MHSALKSYPGAPSSELLRVKSEQCIHSIHTYFHTSILPYPYTYFHRHILPYSHTSIHTYFDTYLQLFIYYSFFIFSLLDFDLFHRCWPDEGRGPSPPSQTAPERYVLALSDGYVGCPQLDEGTLAAYLHVLAFPILSLKK